MPEFPIPPLATQTYSAFVSLANRADQEFEDGVFPSSSLNSLPKVKLHPPAHNILFINF